MKKLEIKTNGKTVKILLVVFIILLALPSIIYIATGNSISDYNCGYDIIFQLKIDPIINGILFLILFGLISLFYVIILKHYKNIFKSNKEIIIYIIIIAILFTIILPMTSTDVFYYISTGWSEAKYNVNPYYTSVSELMEIEQIQDDEILNKVPEMWSNQKIVYGPVWPFVCKLLTLLSFGKLSLALIIFKIFNLIIHLLNCKLIYKISNKKLFALIYALNPLVLFEGLTNVHNDMLLIFFILLALYLAIKKKNIVLSVIALAVATAIKYVAILLVPFIVIYYYRKEKVSKRILNSIWLAIIFLIVLCGIYLIYMRDLNVLQGIFTQQGKYSKSLLLIICMYVNMETADKLTTIFTFLFIAFLIIEVIINLFNKKVTLRKNLRTSYTIVFIFLFLVITNFQLWYIIWLMPLLMYQNKKTIKSTINLTIAAELASTLFFVYGEPYTYGPYFSAIMLVLWIIFNKVKFNKFIEFNII